MVAPNPTPGVALGAVAEGPRNSAYSSVLQASRTTVECTCCIASSRASGSSTLSRRKSAFTSGTIATPLGKCSWPCQIRIEQACYRGLLGSPKTKGSRRTLPLPNVLVAPLIRIHEQVTRTGEEDLVFQTRNGTPFNDTNLLHRHLKPAGWRIGMPSLSWHTLRRTHATLLQAAGASLRDTQAQLGHSRMSTTLEVYTLPIPAHLRLAVENLSQLVTNGDESHQSRDGLPPVAE